MSPYRSGFTLIELMVTLAVLTILVLAALPSFVQIRQRAAIRSASEQVLGFWNEARFESAKRNALVKVGVKTASGGAFCLGAATTTSTSDNTPCDCTTATPGTNICNIARFPSDQSEWRGATLSGTPTVAVIEPKRGSLTESGDAGAMITVAAPPGTRSYKINMIIDQFGRAALCESSADTSKLPDYAGRQCLP
jgi:type IV fimbrial biogenesis protein FimT